MKPFKVSYILIFAVTCCFLENCKHNDDNSMQPYDGYPLLRDTEEIKEYLKGKGVDIIKFRKGEVIADIGAGNGYIEAMLSIYNDSLTFYIQDIDTSICNQRTISDVVNFYQSIYGRPFTNTFIMVEGADKETNLPDETFDKILMLWTYQYLKNPLSIMTDLKAKLKKDGLMYIINPDIDFESGKQLNLKYGWNASPIEKEISDIIECGFELIRISRNNFCYDQPYIMVFKKKDYTKQNLIIENTY